MNDEPLVNTPPQSVPLKGKKGLSKPPRKSKAVRRLQFDEDKSSPVSGTIIRDIREVSSKKLELGKDEDCRYEETALGIQVRNLSFLPSYAYIRNSNAIIRM